MSKDRYFERESAYTSAATPTANLPERQPLAQPIPLEGFTTIRQEVWVRGAMRTIGLPTDNITAVRYKPNQEEAPGLQGTADYKTGELALYTQIGNKKEKRNTPMRVLLHEQLHHVCPFNKHNDEVYGGKEQREKVMDFMYDVAQQTDITGVTLNGYHKGLHKKFQNGEISVGRFLRETHTILGEMRVFEPEKLEKIQEKQRKRFAELKPYVSELADLEFTELMGRDTNGEAVGVDIALMKAFKEVDTTQQLDTRMRRIAQYADTFGNPFAEDRFETNLYSITAHLPAQKYTELPRVK